MNWPCTPMRKAPGQGRVTDLAAAQGNTRDHLLALSAPMRKAIGDGVDMRSAVRSFDARPLLRPAHAAEPMPGNASRAHLEREREWMLHATAIPATRFQPTEVHA